MASEDLAGLATAQLRHLSKELAATFPESIVGYGRSWSGSWPASLSTGPELEQYVVVRITRPMGDPLEVGVTLTALVNLTEDTIEAWVHRGIRKAVTEPERRWIAAEDGTLTALDRSAPVHLDGGTAQFGKLDGDSDGPRHDGGGSPT